MTTIFLRFPDATTFTSLLPQGAQAVGETFNQMPDGIAAISVIGQVAADPANPASVAGYLVNALPTQYAQDGSPVVPTAFAAYVTTPDPATPVRVFG